MSNIPITYIEFASCDTPSIRLLYSDIDISWKQALLVYRKEEEEAEREELFNLKLQARVKRLLMKRQKKTGDMASSSYCQETTATATATNESSIPHRRAQREDRQHRASLCFAVTDQRREQVVMPMKMKVEKEEDCQSTLFDSSDFDTPSGYRVSTPTHWPTLDEVAVVDDVLPAPPATPISHKLLLHKEESSIYNERGLDDFVFKLRHHQTDGRRVVHRTHTARCA